MNQTGIPRQPRQYGFHIVPAVKRDGQWRIEIILAPCYENYFSIQENCRLKALLKAACEPGKDVQNGSAVATDPDPDPIRIQGG